MLQLFVVVLCGCEVAANKETANLRVHQKSYLIFTARKCPGFDGFSRLTGVITEWIYVTLFDGKSFSAHQRKTNSSEVHVKLHHREQDDDRIHKLRKPSG